MNSSTEAVCSTLLSGFQKTPMRWIIGQSRFAQQTVKNLGSVPRKPQASHGNSNNSTPSTITIDVCLKASAIKNSICHLSLAFGVVAITTIQAKADRLNADQFAIVAENCAPTVSLDILSGVASVESRFHPYAIGVGGSNPRSIFPDSQSEAISVVRQLMAAGERFDAGIAQINVENWDWLELSAETVFDVCTNLSAAEVVLRDGYDRARRAGHSRDDALQIALSTYNTGHSERGVTNGYVGRVMNDAGRDGVRVAASASPTTASPGEDASRHWDVYGSTDRSSAIVFSSQGDTN
ncbi:lytic transglycosylase domain-containing protein [Roseobacter weihaiensis]|uniref:lytic transglycosylase domain-containing protein n=1 Tax=Roseobacter weihaiensis TaxID=2763262 RepID=UPI001D0BDDC4|nr:lytic transglycosylase domain-containing protein [Roseobacter sp. H9]